MTRIGAFALLGSRSGWAGASQDSIRTFDLRLEPSVAPLLGAEYPKVNVWAFNGQVPGTEIRVRQGERVRIAVSNKLAQETTVHWHGLRIPNAQDGVPHLTQKPIAPGERFVYEFECPDAGTFWYHPHTRSAEQMGRGLYGAFIVEEPAPLPVDRDVTWMLDDWQFTRAGQLSDAFNDLHDMTHGGQIGNVVSLNGTTDTQPLHLRKGERVRLRLINAANARIYALNFTGHSPRVIAYDGQPVAPHAPADDRVVLGPAMRVDLVIDATGDPGKSYPVRDTFYRRFAYELTDLVYDAEPLRREPLPDSIALAPNPLTEPDLTKAQSHEIRFQGGAMGQMRHAQLNGRRVDIREMVRAGKAWAVNGVVADGHVLDPILTLQRGRSYRLTLLNDTAWPHPIHLHGHSFRVIRRNGRPTAHSEWQDTVLIPARESADVAFVADNPGDWMFHCHILEHQEAGMTAVIRVA
ncbi:MAG TPA: multicopper oxidase family protein [Burkholderiales bacterium]